MVSTQMDYLFPTGKWKFVLFPALHTFHPIIWILNFHWYSQKPSHFRYSLPFFTKETSHIFKASSLFQIQWSDPRLKACSEVMEKHVMVMQKKDKSNSPFRNFIKSCFTLIWNTNLAPRASKKALDVLGTNKRRSFWINIFNWITCLFWF